MSELRSIQQMSMNPAHYFDRGYLDSVLLVARGCMAAVFIFSGAAKLVGWQLAIIEFQQLDIPLPGMAVVATVAIQLLAGLAIAIGWQFRTAAATLTVFTFVATLVGHQFWTHEGAEFHRQLTTALEHLAIVGGFLLLMITGPGRLSLQATRRK